MPLESNILKTAVDMPKRTERKMTQTFNVKSYVKSHLASLGTLLTVSGGFYLYSVIRTGWVPTDGVSELHSFTSLALEAPVLSPYLIPAFFVTSLPIFLIGVIMLCYYTLDVLRNGLTVDSEHVAILLTVCGFSYQVLGAWPLQAAANFPWTWQKQIMNYGSVFAWLLYLLSLVMLVLGVVSLFVHSRAYHKAHPELVHEEN
jgi:hypothetical protein